MISLDEAWAQISTRVAAHAGLSKERVSLWSARGRVLAEQVTSAVDLPASDYSAMDGYAVRTEDFKAGEVALLPVLGECQTGHASLELTTRGCLRIFTGAHLPPGADAVVMQENTQRNGNEVSVLKAPELGENVRRRGEDVARGALLLPEGTRLTAHQLGLLASAERTDVIVRRRPRVSVVCTGDELRPFGSQFYGGQLAESNSIALAALCAEAGAEVTISPLVRDELPRLMQAMLEASLHADLVVTVGGVSVGDHDLVAPAVEGLGGEIIFHKVAIKPGKPVLFAQHERALILGLPGNPASAQVVFSLLGLPLLRGLSGDNSPTTSPRSAHLTHDFFHKPGRRSFYRARLDGDQVTVLSNQASGATTSMAWANALLELKEHVEGYVTGQTAPVWAFSDF